MGWTDHASEEAMREDAVAVNRVVEALDRYYWAFSTRDLEQLRDVFAADDAFLAFGTDAGEFWIGYAEFEAYAKAMFEALTDVRFERRSLQVRLSPEADVAWFAETSIGHFTTRDTCVEEKLRTSGVFVLEGAEWRLAHFHRSVPVKGTAVAYKPRKKLPDRF
jgi:uncharacterized protein (TIGR02246 family)